MDDDKIYKKQINITLNIKSLILSSQTFKNYHKKIHFTDEVEISGSLLRTF